ncbi:MULTISPECIES: amino acid ABC transporter permease [unclassified Streptomyces]|uniref:amino acid ABC transporter permease n=1 Tax=unclassified Streptomyces TaxID=2593676 RepID=UPI0006AED678|nr:MULTISPECIES: amino acid ABC transporter permease [unclassified Streptomyces]KOX16399.1 amino acid ABC transporter permease [Streptomyces sp. NRRL F-6491]KOX39232.1 amino acid ABC transporter permease [Streptomyces sp. NRRL F-6492]
MSSVLYDTPGPRAKRRNVLYTVGFLAVLALVAWWVLSALADKHQLDADKWSPFVTDSRVWTTYLLPGLVETLKAAALSILIALPLGALLGIGRLSDHRWVRVPVGVVVEFFRAIPVLLLMVFASSVYREFTTVGSDFRPLYAVVTGLVLYNASVIAEVVRAGVLSLPRGQGDAAVALGMRKGQTMLYVLLPQAVTVMLPALVSQLVVIVKDTALGGALLGFAELLSQNRQITANYGANTIATFTVIALIFIALNFALTTLAGRLERRLRQGRKTAGVTESAVTKTGEAPAEAVSGA